MRNPLISLLILTYNQEDFIEETVKGALAQDYDNLEIIFSDDKSPDKTFEIIELLVASYKGPHRVELYKNSHNMGLIPHFNYAMMNYVHGEYVLLQGGDDISLPERTKISYAKIEELGVNSLTFNLVYINAKSQTLGKKLTEENESDRIYTLDNYNKGELIRTGGPSRIFLKKVYDYFGPFLPDCPTEDTTLTFRALLLGGIGYSSIPLVNYRLHNHNISNTEGVLDKLDCRCIYKQYKKDLELAKQNNLISKKLYQQTDKTITKYLNEKSTFQDLYRKKSLYSRILFSIHLLFSYHISWKRKLINFWYIAYWKKKGI